MTLRKNFEADFKKVQLTWGTAEEREAKGRISWRKKEWLHYPSWIDAKKEEEDLYH